MKRASLKFLVYELDLQARDKHLKAFTLLISSNKEYKLYIFNESTYLIKRQSLSSMPKEIFSAIKPFPL